MFDWSDNAKNRWCITCGQPLTLDEQIYGYLECYNCRNQGWATLDFNNFNEEEEDDSLNSKEILNKILEQLGHKDYTDYENIELLREYIKLHDYNNNIDFSNPEELNYKNMEKALRLMEVSEELNNRDIEF